MRSFQSRGFATRSTNATHISYSTPTAGEMFRPTIRWASVVHCAKPARPRCCWALLPNSPKRLRSFAMKASMPDGEYHANVAPVHAPMLSADEAVPTRTPDEVDIGDCNTKSVDALSEQATESPQRFCKVTFTMAYHTGYGKALKIIGNERSLGSWSLSSSPKMIWGSGDVWSITLDIPESAVIEYKYAVVDRFGGCVAWQNGNNNVLIVKHRQEAMTVTDNWQGAAFDAMVKSPNGGVVPRQNQLLNWASEMEMMIDLSKNKLRQTRMELMDARMESKASLEEAEYLTEMVNIKKEETRQNAAKIQSLREEAKELRSQIAEAEYDFTSGLEAVIDLMDEASDLDGECIYPANETHAVETGDMASQIDKGHLVQFTPTPSDCSTGMESSETTTAASLNTVMSASASTRFSSPSSGGAPTPSSEEELSTAAMQCNASDAFLQTGDGAPPSVSLEIEDVMGSQHLQPLMINEELPNDDEFDYHDTSALPDYSEASAATSVAGAATIDAEGGNRPCEHDDPRLFIVSSHTKCTSHQVLLRTCHGYAV